MTINIYYDLKDPTSIKEIVKKWKTVEKQDKSLLAKAIIELVINLIGFEYVLTREDLEAPEGREKYQQIVAKFVDSNYVHTSCIFASKDKERLISRLDSFVQKVVASVENVEGCGWLDTFIRFTDELLENVHEMTDIVAVAAFVRLNFLEHLTGYRRQLSASNSELIQTLENLSLRLFETINRGLYFVDINETYANTALHLFLENPDYYILERNQLDKLVPFFSVDNLKIIIQSYEALVLLMEGNDIEDDDTRNDVRMEISNFFIKYIDVVFHNMIMSDRVKVSKAAFQVLLLVQKYRGMTPIHQKPEQIEDIKLAFMHNSKTIRPLAMVYMKFTMKSPDILQFILSNCEKYDIPIPETITSIFDRSVFVQWEIYLNYMKLATNVRGCDIMIQIVKEVITLLTREYREDAKKKRDSRDLSPAKQDILDFLVYFTKFLHWNRVTNPHAIRYWKMLKMINVIEFEDFKENVSNDVLEALMKEYSSALETFESFTVISGVMNAIFALRHVFSELADPVDAILELYSNNFTLDDILTSDGGELEFKRATYVVYTFVAERKIDLIPEENYKALYSEFAESMLSEVFLRKVPAPGALLAFWSKVMGKCFKIAIQTMKETKVDEGPMSVRKIQGWMLHIMTKMKKIVDYACETRQNYLYTDINLILLNVGDLMHFMSLGKFMSSYESYALTFTSMVKITEIMLIGSPHPEILGSFTAFYDVHYDLISNHHEISRILQHLGDPRIQIHRIICNLFSVAHTHDTSQDKKTFRVTLAQTIVTLFQNTHESHETRISLFWTEFHKILTTKINLSRKDFLLLIANLAFEILQLQLKEPRNDDGNRFHVFDIFGQLTDEIKKSNAVLTSVHDVFSRVQTKHEQDFTPDENQSLKEFLKKLTINTGETTEE